jgi:hypothetical protein
MNGLKLPQPRDLTLLVNPTQTPKVNSAFIIRGHLYTATYALADKEVYARYQYRASPSQQWGDWKYIGTTRTMSYADSGLYGFSVPLTQKGWYTFETVFSGDSTYHGSGSNRVEVVVT